MKPASPRLKILTRAALLAAAFLMAGTAFAIDQPPQDSEQQRAWLVGHIVSDMQALGTFDGNALAKVPGIVSSLTDEQVALLAQYYYLTRSKTLQDASLYAMQQQGDSQEQLDAATAALGDLLTEMNDQIEACQTQLASMPQPVQYLAQACYASVPGWCDNAQCFVPDGYYGNGCFLGPCYNSGYAGAWAVPVYNAYYNRGSRFYTNYHKVANSTRINRSTSLAHSHADRLRHSGDWRKTLAHDRLVRGSATTYRAASAASTRYRTGNHFSSVRSVPSARVGTSRVGVSSYKPVVRQAKARTQASHATAGRRVAVPRATARARVSRVSASHVRASRPAAHVSHARPAAHAQAHAGSGGHAGRRR